MVSDYIIGNAKFMYLLPPQDDGDTEPDELRFPNWSVLMFAGVGVSELDNSSPAFCIFHL